MLNEIRIFELRIMCSNSNSILKIRYSNPTCTKTGVGIEAWLSHNHLPTRCVVFVLCRPLPPAASPVHWCGRRYAADVWLPLPAPTPLSTFAVTPHSLPSLRLLQSAFADRYHVLCNEANDTAAIGDPHWVDVDEHNSPHELQLRYSFATCKPFGWGSATIGNQREQLRRIVTYQLFFHSPRTLGLWQRLTGDHRRPWFPRRVSGCSNAEHRFNFRSVSWAVDSSASVVGSASVFRHDDLVCVDSVIN